MYRSQWAGISLALMVALLTQLSGPSRAATNSDVTTIEIIADDMCCKGCAQKVAAQLYAAPGVTSVEADVPNRKIVITAKPSPKLTLDRLWKAVEQGKGGPSKLITSEATYVFTPKDKLQPQQRLSEGHYSLVIRELQNKENAQEIANRLYAVPAIKNVSVDLANSTLFLQSSPDSVLSPWLLATVVRQAGNDPISIGSPHGMLTIEWTKTNDAATAARFPYPQTQGDIR